MGKDVLFHEQIIDLLQGPDISRFNRQQRFVTPTAQALRDVQRYVVDLGEDPGVLIRVLPGPLERLGETLQHVTERLALERVGEGFVRSRNKRQPGIDALAADQHPRALLLGKRLIDTKGGPGFDLAGVERGQGVGRQDEADLDVLLIDPGIGQCANQQVLGNAASSRRHHDIAAFQVGDTMDIRIGWHQDRNPA
ncbi:hypothetical protein D3C85_1155930 [compost metagenome]